ncbi:MAG TPA: sugar phosphate nucleotidyltransferase [Bryobacteraceae bacterium]|nr:sugar phosphate nucleotidyltransferase [Bryobacteraceae bacterium]
MRGIGTIDFRIAIAASRPTKLTLARYHETLKITKAVITAAGRNQRTLPLQTLVDRDGVEKPLLRMLLEESLCGSVEQACIVVAPGDEAAYAQAAGDLAGRIHFVVQHEPRGYGHALWCARGFTGGDAFLHVVGDHVYVGAGGRRCAQNTIELAEREECSVSAVQSTRENEIGRFGTVGGQRLPGPAGLYRIDTVIEKPTPTEAEQELIVPGLRAGHYLCFFGVHALTPLVMDILEKTLNESEQPVSLSPALAQLARREQYLALEERNQRFDVGVRYGLLNAQLALALNGRDRSDILARLVELLAGEADRADSRARA